MSTEAPSALPRKKPNVLWWLAGGFVLLLLWFFFQLFGSTPPIIVSRETTYITEPLGPNGLPDYEKHVLEMYRDGVTPENNAAVLLWQALWPGGLDPKDYAAVAAELGLSEIPSSDDSLKLFHGNENQAAILAWLQTRGAAPVKDESEPVSEEDSDSPDSELVDKIIGQAMTSPWTSEQIPPLAEWVKANRAPLDLIVEATRRPRYYAPSPTLLDKNHDTLIAMLLPCLQGAREAARALSARAMLHVAENRLTEAWQDVFAMHRLAHLVAQGRTHFDQLVGMVISDMAGQVTTALLDSEHMTVELARQIQQELEALQSFSEVGNCLNGMERLSGLDAILYTKEHGIQSLIGMNGPEPESRSIVDAASVNWNIVLKRLNQWYDRLNEAAQLPPGEQRSAVLQQFDADMSAQASDIRTPGRIIAAFVNRNARSELFAEVVASLMLPAITAATTAEDRTNTNLELTRLAAALAVYRAEHKIYPTKLDELVPSVLKTLPVDLFHAKPFLYKRDGDGYLLYSAGPNGSDDGGSDDGGGNEQMSTLHGRELGDLPSGEQEAESRKIPTGADDLSIRVPRPVFEMPTLPKQ